jgi:hypothetical protein
MVSAMHLDVLLSQWCSPSNHPKVGVSAAFGSQLFESLVLALLRLSIHSENTAFKFKQQF